MPRQLKLISHHLCPYVQRAAIVLSEKMTPFERQNIDLANPPTWFSVISPLGKVPILLIDHHPIFESVVICEYLDEIIAPRMHPTDPIERARHRSWIEFASYFLDAIWAFYTATDDVLLDRRAHELAFKANQLEAELAEGPYFAGAHFSIVDAAFGPVFRYFDVFDLIEDFGVFRNTPKVRAWRRALAARDSVMQAVTPDYPDHLRDFLLARNSALSNRMQTLA
ncbi:MAG: glutathione S-transferase family protein [Gammaproteobacteria bacterium]|nr:glutathione S-transferase family protein [Gammaproteobacteria bacterium]